MLYHDHNMYGYILICFLFRYFLCLYSVIGCYGTHILEKKVYSGEKHAISKRQLFGRKIYGVSVDNFNTDSRRQLLARKI